MFFWGFPPTRLASRFSSMKAVVGGGIQRRQRMTATVTAITASTVRQRIRRTLDRMAPLEADVEVTEQAVFDRYPDGDREWRGDSFVVRLVPFSPSPFQLNSPAREVWPN